MLRPHFQRFADTIRGPARLGWQRIVDIHKGLLSRVICQARIRVRVLGNEIDVAFAVGEQQSGPVLVAPKLPGQPLGYRRLPLAWEEIALFLGAANRSFTDGCTG